MSFVTLFLLQAVVVGSLIGLVSLVCGVRPFRLDGEEVRTRFVQSSPYVALLAGIYLLNRSSHTVGQEVSARFGVHISATLYALEGDVVADLQGVIPYDFAGYFTFVYLFGFAFVLVFPVVAYFALPSYRHLETLFLAYAVNYGVGAVCYVAFIAYGPRNVIVHASEPMYELYPQAATLTGAVNSSANVFPSLHVSLTVAVALLAWRTRAVYPRWTWIATFLAGQIIVATMFLGIHWLIDVLAGIGLAAVSVAVAVRVVDRRRGGELESAAVGRERERRPRVES